MIDEMNNIGLVCNECNSLKSDGDDLYIKANLPSSENNYVFGIGEGCWFTVSEDVKKAYDNDEEGTSYIAILRNDSFYYTGLVYGTECPIEMRGTARPVVPYSWLVEHYGESNWE